MVSAGVMANRYGIQLYVAVMMAAAYILLILVCASVNTFIWYLTYACSIMYIVFISIRMCVL